MSAENLPSMFESDDSSTLESDDSSTLESDDSSTLESDDSFTFENDDSFTFESNDSMDVESEELDESSCTVCLELLQAIRNIASQSHIITQSEEIQFIIVHFAHILYGSCLSSLHVACLLENFELVELVVEQGADVNVQTEKLQSPLHVLLNELSCLSDIPEDNIKILDYLLSNGADLHLRNDVYETPLHIAVGMSDISAVKCILKYPCNLNVLASSSTPLMNAARSGPLEIVTLLLDNGADPNIVDIPLRKLAIHYSIWPGNGQIFKCLLDKTDCFLYNKHKYLSLMLYTIINVDATDCLEILIKSNCWKYFCLEKTLDTPQFCSNYSRMCFIGYLLKEQEIENWDQMLRIMLQNGLPINSVSVSCIPPLSVVTLLCLKLSDPERYISTLIQYGADVNYPNAGEPEALLNTCRHGNAEVMLLLLQHSEFATPDSVISGYIRIDDVRNINPEVISLFFKVGMTSSAVRLLSMGRTEGIPTGYVSTLQQLCRLTLRHFFYSMGSNLRIDDILKKCNLPLIVREYIRYRTEKPV